MSNGTNEMVWSTKNPWNHSSLTSKSIHLRSRISSTPASRRSIKWRNLPWRCSTSCGSIAWKTRLFPTTNRGEKVEKSARSSQMDSTVELWVLKSIEWQSITFVRFSTTTFLWAAFSLWTSVSKIWSSTSQSFHHRSFWGSSSKARLFPSYSHYRLLPQHLHRSIHSPKISFQTIRPNWFWLLIMIWSWLMNVWAHMSNSRGSLSSSSSTNSQAIWITI